MPVGQEQLSSSINRLLECSATVFALTAKLRRDAATGSLSDFRNQIIKSFDVLERMAFERQIGTSTVQDAKYALAAYVDETVLASENPERMEWMSQPLQLKFFGEHLAGEAFFEKLNKLRQGGEKNLDLLELYYTCLQLGFEGMYRMRGLEALMALQVDLRSQIDGYRGIVDPKLAPDGVPKTGIIARVSHNIPYWVIAVLTVGLLFFSYAGYSVMLADRVDNTLQSLDQQLTMITTHSQSMAEDNRSRSE
ncbi:MAG: type IVB secretion system protein IcmH/DotU [Candidatus Thiodiazotropha sp. (ex Monitilora ramsayi)]|nr:type IVB secretion system protein IcmH/DotU [Candidatus Thiodiazotropha sp. (ex Monitilora ramsayi)]